MAVSYAQELLRHDELHEATYRRLMRLHRARGDRASALRVYHAGVGVLDRELGIAPSAQTSDLYEAVRSGATPSPASSATAGGTAILVSSLVGRSTAWRGAFDAWHEASTGRAQVLLVTGEPGIGKTRLLEEVAKTCRSDGVRVARTRSYAAEGRLAWGPIVDWLRSEALSPHLAGLEDVWLSELARVLPELRAARPSLPIPAPVSDADQRRHLFDTLARAIRIKGSPLLLVLDDLQWCDPDTVEFLHFLVRTEPEAPLLIAATARSEDVDGNETVAAMRSSLLAAHRLTEIVLEPLAEPAVVELASQLSGGALPADAVERLYLETEGNPLFVVEAIRAGHTDRDKARLSPTVRAVVMDRITQLSEEARQLVEVAATIGREFGVDVLIQARGADDDTTLDALDELWRRRIVREQAGVYDFSHDIIREVAYDAISPARRRRLHRSVATALLTLYGDDIAPVAARLATHYEQAGLVAEAVEAHRRAAEHAYVVFAIDDSLASLRRALFLLDRLPSGRSRDELELELRTSLGPPYIARAGYGAAEVEATYQRAVQLSRRLARPASAPVLRGLAIAAIGGCHFDRSAELGRGLLAQVDDDALAFVEGNYVLGVTEFWRGNLPVAREHLEIAISSYDPRLALDHLARFAQDPEAICTSRLALVEWHLGHPAAAVATAEQALEQARTLGHPTTLGYVLNYVAILSDELGDLPWLHELLETGGELWTRQRLRFFEPQVPLFGGWLDVLAGDPGGIEAIREGVAGWRHEGHTLHLTYALATLARACLRLGDVATGCAAVQEALIWSRDHDQLYLEPELHRLHGELLAHAGAGADAEVAIRQAVELAAQRGARSFELRAACSMARHVPSVGSEARLRAVYERFHDADQSSDLREAAVVLAAGS